MIDYIEWLKREIRALEMKIIFLRNGMGVMWQETPNNEEAQRVVNEQIFSWNIDLNLRRETLAREEMSRFPSSDYSRD